MGKLKNYLKRISWKVWRDRGLLRKIDCNRARDAGIVLVEAWEKEIKEKYHRSWGLKTLTGRVTDEV